MVDFTVAIIAGGKSSRMGTNKALQEIGGQAIIERIIARTANLGQAATLMITNQPDEYAQLGLPMHADVIADKGSLGGIYSSLKHSTTPHTLVTACDMPFIAPELLRYMLSLLADTSYDVVVPRVETYPQGLHAIYSQQCIEPIHERLLANRLKVIGFYDAVSVRYLDEAEYQPYDPDGTAFMNVNTPDELKQARDLLE